MASALTQLPPEQLSLINSLLRRKDLQVREIARMTFSEMGQVGHKRSLRGWEACLYRHREGKNHLQVVRSGNLMQDPFVASDLLIMAIEAALVSDTVSIPLLSALKTAKTTPTTLMDKLEADVIAKTSAADAEKSTCNA